MNRMKPSLVVALSALALISLALIYYLLRRSGTVTPVITVTQPPLNEQPMPEPIVVKAPIEPTPTKPDARIDINTATLDELVALPGIGPVLAQAVVEYRAKHGPFETPDDITHVKGIGLALAARLKDKIRTGS
jgi:competence ComEA-like helix-hairpin-helix protein